MESVKEEQRTFSPQKKVREAYRPEIKYDSFTKSIFYYQFKRLGFDLQKVNGEGINHHHIR